ncbi:hypothetical protein CFOL_v3_07843 [Cephalotus follicularis]|uniref:Uncharacterized protein n=1 Tax=Cephalotus follicularis TaxID=3775 RepID=A0A1Q3B8V0_CEPFO|nr:hypothetical protein CFOL_v3_07843 [Cephalotus follicularis]
MNFVITSGSSGGSSLLSVSIGPPTKKMKTAQTGKTSQSEDRGALPVVPQVIVPHGSPPQYKRKATTGSQSSRGKDVAPSSDKERRMVEEEVYERKFSCPASAYVV